MNKDRFILHLNKIINSFQITEQGFSFICAACQDIANYTLGSSVEIELFNNKLVEKIHSKGCVFLLESERSTLISKYKGIKPGKFPIEVRISFIKEMITQVKRMPILDEDSMKLAIEISYEITEANLETIYKSCLK